MITNFISPVRGTVPVCPAAHPKDGKLGYLIRIGDTYAWSPGDGTMRLFLQKQARRLVEKATKHACRFGHDWKDKVCVRCGLEHPAFGGGRKIQ